MPEKNRTIFDRTRLDRSTRPVPSPGTLQTRCASFSEPPTVWAGQATAVPGRTDGLPIDPYEMVGGTGLTNVTGIKDAQLKVNKFHQHIPSSKCSDRRACCSWPPPSRRSPRSSCSPKERPHPPSWLGSSPRWAEITSAAADQIGASTCWKRGEHSSSDMGDVASSIIFLSEGPTRFNQKTLFA